MQGCLFHTARKLIGLDGRLTSDCGGDKERLGKWPFQLGGASHSYKGHQPHRIIG